MLHHLGWPVVYDATHSVQLPGGGDGVTAGQAEYIEPLAAAAVAAGVDGVFVEVHDNPARAKSDAQNALALDRVEPLVRHLMRIHDAAREKGAGSPFSTAPAATGLPDPSLSRPRPQTKDDGQG